MKWVIGMKTTVITSELRSGNKKKKEDIKTLEDAGLVLAYVACVLKEGFDIDKHLYGLDIENDEYKDVKDRVDKLVEQAVYCSVGDYPITTEKDTWRYYEDAYWRHYGDDGDYMKLQEHKRKWMENPWAKFYRYVERLVENIKKKNNSNDALYECNGYYFIINA